MAHLTEREMRGCGATDIAMIFQEPMTSLNPLYTVGRRSRVADAAPAAAPATPGARASSC
jgi:ABC-type microcin C transport system duplicated ATPase subunit YejF